MLGCLALGLANLAAAQSADDPLTAPPAEEPAPSSGPASTPASTTTPSPALPESEPALTVDANGLPRISGFQHNAPKPIVDLVEAMAPAYQLAPELVLAFMQAESSYNPNALSPKNARGLMQLIPGTAERFNVRKPFDPKQNIRGGMAYLRWLLAYFEGDLRLVAAGYNAGERRVDRYLGVPPYGETQAYVKRVVDALGIEAHPYDASITEPSARLEQIRASRARP
jgi:soluble lytic murein transglycosylase-like protein